MKCYLLEGLDIQLDQTGCDLFVQDFDYKILPEIGREFSNRDHTTVIHSVKTIEKLKTENNEILNGINHLKNQILYKKENEIQY